MERAGSGTIWDGVPYMHFLGWPQTIPRLLFWETPYQYAAGSARMHDDLKTDAIELEHSAA